MAELDDDTVPERLVVQLAIPAHKYGADVETGESPDDVVGLEDVNGSLGGVTDHQDDHHTRQQGRHRTVASGRWR